MARYLVACDTSGTMTDVIVVDEQGRSVIGKAPTTPHDESVGYMDLQGLARPSPARREGVYGQDLGRHS